MSKKVEVILNEYVKRLSDEDLAFLKMRCTQKLYGDRADSINVFSRDRDIDRWLSSATSAEEFFDMLDLIGDHVVQESERRDKR